MINPIPNWVYTSVYRFLWRIRTFFMSVNLYGYKTPVTPLSNSLYNSILSPFLIVTILNLIKTKPIKNEVKHNCKHLINRSKVDF